MASFGLELDEERVLHSVVDAVAKQGRPASKHEIDVAFGDDPAHILGDLLADGWLRSLMGQWIPTLKTLIVEYPDLERLLDAVLRFGGEQFKSGVSKVRVSALFKALNARGCRASLASGRVDSVSEVDEGVFVAAVPRGTGVERESGVVHCTQVSFTFRDDVATARRGTALDGALEGVLLALLLGNVRCAQERFKLLPGKQHRTFPDDASLPDLVALARSDDSRN